MTLGAALSEGPLDSVAGFNAERLWQATIKTAWARPETPVVFKKQTRAGSEC